MEKPKINIPDFGKLIKPFEPTKINQETLDKINEGIEEKHKQEDRKYKLEIGLVIIGLFLGGYSTYLTYAGNQNSKQIEKQTQQISDLENEVKGLRTTISSRDNEVSKLRQTLDSIKTSLTMATRTRSK